MTTIEQEIYLRLKSLVSNRVYPDVPPDNMQLPFILYQQVGGESEQYIDNMLPDARHSRIQINVWSETRAEANTIAREIEKTLVESDLVCEAYGGLTAIYDDDAKLYGTRQDFGFWY